MKSILIAILVLSMSTFAAVRPKKIIGADERTKVQNLFAAPYSAIGQIDNNCTGSLVAPDIVITAAHCIVDIFAKTLVFSVTREGSNSPFGSLSWQNIMIPKRYVDTESKEHDFAFIFLTRPVDGDHHQFSLTERFDPHTPITIAGYPVDKKNQMWKSDCLAKTEGGKLLYSCDTKGGMSGAPIFQRVSDQFKLVGIHTRWEDDSNAGVLMTSLIPEYFKMAQHGISSGQIDNRISLIGNPYLELNTDDYSKLYFKNNCREHLVIHHTTMDIKGKFHKKILFLAPRKTKLATKSYDETVYYAARSRSGAFERYGKEMCGQGASWPKCFIGATIDLRQDKNTIQIDCK